MHLSFIPNVISIYLREHKKREKAKKNIKEIIQNKEFWKNNNMKTKKAFFKK